MSIYENAITKEFIKIYNKIGARHGYSEHG
jgi:hypothetical protein